jgi:VanZ family protein
MNRSPENMAFIQKIIQINNNILIPGISGFILAFLLCIGLWPFNFFPKNGCQINRNGTLEFTQNGYVYATIPLNEYRFLEDSFSIDCEFIPESLPVYEAVIISIYTRQLEILSIRQHESQLVIRSDSNKKIIPINGNIQVKSRISCDVNRNEIIVHWGTKEIIVPRRTNRHQENPVQVLIGNDVRMKNPWIGRINELSITSGTQRSQSDASQSTLTWPQKQANNSLPFHIPDRIFPLRPQILIPPWVDYKNDREYLVDIFVNFLGFFPAGFFFCALACIYWYSSKKTILLTLFVCISISLFIEFAQVLLPTRSSQLSDVLLNSLGGFFGAIGYHRYSIAISFLQTGIKKRGTLNLEI